MKRTGKIFRTIFGIDKEDDINWVPMETILLSVYENDFNDNKFIDNLLKQYSVLTK